MQRSSEVAGTPERIALNPGGVTGRLLAVGPALIKAAITVIVILLGTLLTTGPGRRDHIISALNVARRISRGGCGPRNNFPELRLMWRGVISFPWKRQQFFMSLAL